MTADRPTVCPTCQGVIVSPQSDSYTPARGRLIVTNGYCPGTCEAAVREEVSVEVAAGS
ncbi:hypothetical protein SAMN05444920_11994 [Nonomuraea solani]|uniref:Uncharacterized protein n=1 Tax=Nonomuraea solani TaxID=1144553 RepID=A0A1H6EWW4_9ACTN|nr:hypothetical protein SAMN05444920_11994 [Nonomuraea solani]